MSSHIMRQDFSSGLLLRRALELLHQYVPSVNIDLSTEMHRGVAENYFEHRVEAPNGIDPGVVSAINSISGISLGKTDHHYPV